MKVYLEREGRSACFKLCYNHWLDVSVCWTMVLSQVMHQLNGQITRRLLRCLGEHCVQFDYCGRKAAVVLRVRGLVVQAYPVSIGEQWYVGHFTRYPSRSQPVTQFTIQVDDLRSIALCMDERVVYRCSDVALPWNRAPSSSWGLIEVIMSIYKLHRTANYCMYSMYCTLYLYLYMTENSK